MAKADWEQDIEHELKLVQCTECTHMANWLRTYQLEEDQVDVFVCGSCGHEMHIHHEEVDGEGVPYDKAKLTPDLRPIKLKPEDQEAATT